MKWFFPVYWIIGCFIVGMALHSRVLQCPDKPLPAATELAAMIVMWGAVMYPAFKGVTPKSDIAGCGQ